MNLTLVAVLEGALYVFSIHIFEKYHSWFRKAESQSSTANPGNNGFSEQTAQLSEYQKLNNFYKARRNPDIIKKRICGAIFSTVIAASLSLLCLFLGSKRKYNLQQALELMGLTFLNEPMSSIVLFLMSCCVYAGPLYYGLLLGDLPVISQSRYFWLSIKQWSEFRNYIVGPITEELVFRCSIVPLFIESGLSGLYIQFFAPLIFGIAHLHHIIEKRSAGIDWKHSILSTVGQFVYTYVFGVFITFIFIRYKSIYACIIAHIFCNVMGLPIVESDDLFNNNKKGVIYAYILGLAGFVLILRTML